MTPEERQEKVKLYAEGYESFSKVLETLPKEMWQFKPSPKDWSVHEIIIHLADSEAVAAMEVRMFIGQPGGQVMTYDPDAWAANMDYHSQETEQALHMFRITRQTTSDLLKSVTSETWENTVVYPGYDEPYSFDEWLSIYSGHVPDHIEQIKDNYEIWKERQ